MGQTGILLHEPGIANYSTAEAIELGRLADQEGHDSLWVSETYCHNAFTLLGAIAAETEDIELGTGVVNIYSRTPTLLGMSLATLRGVAGDRINLGLGISTDHLVEGWHGLEYGRPLRRTVEVIEVLRESFGASTIDYDGEIFDIGPYSVGYSIPEGGVDIYNAAMGPRNCKMTGEYADGWMPTYVPPDRMPDLRERIDAGAEKRGRESRSIEAAPVVTTAVQESSSAAEEAVRESLAHEMSLGYNSLLHQFDMGEAADRVVEHWRAGEKEQAAAAVSEDMLANLTVEGTAGECASQVDRFRNAANVETIIFRPTVNATYRDVATLITGLA